MGVVKEHNITDLVLGLHQNKRITESYLGKITDSVLSRCNTTTFIYKPLQPVATLKRHIVVIPQNAEKEFGFPFWLSKVWNIPKNTGAKLVFYANEKTTEYIKKIQHKHPIEAEFKIFEDWDDFLIISRDVKSDDNLLIILSKINQVSYHPNMINLPSYLNRYFQNNSFIIVYPVQHVAYEIDPNNPSLVEPFERLDEIGKNIIRLFRRK